MANEVEIAEIIKHFRRAVEEKYDIVEMKLFGSFARGDYSTTSDIDLMVVLPEVDRSIEEDLFNIAYDLELKHDCVIDVIVLPKNFNVNIPVYRNIQKEGIAV